MRIKDAVVSMQFPHGDAEILLAYICGKTRTWIIAHGEYALTLKEEQRWSTYRKRREQGEPIAYITGEKEFFGRPFSVDSSVLIPRPSTEGLVEIALEILRRRAYTPERGVPACRRVMVSPSNHGTRVSPFDRLRVTHPMHQSVSLDTGIIGISELWGPLFDVHTIVDVGTGSGCIAITLACELPDITVIATDISAAALAIARKNAERHGVGERIHFLQGNLLEPVIDLKNPFLIIANSPYIPEREELPIDVSAYEPSMALRAGPDGLTVLRPLITAAHRHFACRGFTVECRADQGKILKQYIEYA